MSAPMHTPGPWWPVQDSGDRWYVTTRRDHEEVDAKPTRFGATVAHGIGDHTEKRTSGNEEANARLIAAAPELLEALSRAIPYLEDATNDCRDVPSEAAHILDAAVRAIAKARGDA